jgi:branched-chain amino acid transport system ATP-binding protein
MSLRTNAVSAKYGRIQVLWDISLEIRKGEVVSIIGSNGAGKSTLLRCIIGLVRLSSGDILFEGKSLAKMDVHTRVRNGISYVPEGRRLFPAMSVEENLLMGVAKRKGDAKNRVREVYGLFQILEERKKQLAGNLSGGEQQMLAIGRALMADPKLMILDELSSGLAPVTFDRVLESVQRINPARGTELRKGTRSFWS